jgi:hypothetical protein
MLLSDQKIADPNYANLKMLSFTYQPSPSDTPPSAVYGMIVEFGIDPFSNERNFISCYDSGFAAFYSNKSGGNINGNLFKHSEEVALKSFEQFIGSTSENFPEPAIAYKSREVLRKAAEYLKYTEVPSNVGDQQDVQFWFLTPSGTVTGKADVFEIRMKTSVWSGLFKEVHALFNDLVVAGADKKKAVKVSSLN